MCAGTDIAQIRTNANTYSLFHILNKVEVSNNKCAKILGNASIQNTFAPKFYAANISDLTELHKTPT